MFKIKLSTVLSIAAGAGVVVTGFLAARGGRKAAQIEFDATQQAVADNISNGNLDIVTSDDDDEVFDEITKEVNKSTRKARLKAYLPAIISGVVTLGCGAYAKRLDTKEIIKLTGALGVATSQLKKLRGDFGTYRRAVIDEVGPQKETEICKKVDENIAGNATTDIRMDVKEFHLDWMGEDLYFDADSPLTVINALHNINRGLHDPEHENWMEPTVSQFFKDVGHPELITKDSDEAGWSLEELRCDCNVEWINYDLILKCHPDGRMYYDIWVDWYPWKDIMGVLQHLENEGII